MKKLETQFRNALEREVLTQILSRPDLLNHFEFWVSDFEDPMHRDVWLAVKHLKEINQTINLINLHDAIEDKGILMSDVSSMFTSDFFQVPDFTEAAKKLREDTIRNLLFRKINDCGDSYEYLKFTDSLRDAGIAYSIQSFEKEFEGYEEEYLRVRQLQEAGESVGILTEWKEFNRKVSLMPNDFVVVGARTSIGKTAFALNLAIQAAANKQKVLFVSMEMGRQSIFDRLFANLIQRNSWDFKLAKVNLELMKQEMAAIKDHFFFVHAPTATTDLVANLASKSKFDLVIVDYLQLLKDRSTKGETENLRLGRISSALKMIAGQRKCVVVSPAQLNRDSEKAKREPTLADLRDSGCIEQDADTVLLLHRDDRESAKARVIIAKNRNGSVGFVNFAYLPSLNKFTEAKDQSLNF